MKETNTHFGLQHESENIKKEQLIANICHYNTYSS